MSKHASKLNVMNNYSIVSFQYIMIYVQLASHKILCDELLYVQFTLG